MKKHDFSNKKNIPPWVDLFSHRRKLLRNGIKSATLFILLASGTAIKAQQISLSLQKAPLSKAISEIRKATKYDFVYNEELLKKVGPITVNLKNASLEETLRTLFANQPIAFEIADGIIILQERRAPNTTNSKKKETIKGKIVDEKGNPLAGATIQVKGSNLVTNTDNSGNFELPSEYAESELKISFLGYAPISVSAKYIDRITLTSNSNVIDEVSVVSTGYQSIPKERTTGSFSKIDNKTFTRQVSTDIVSRLKGIAPSLYFDERNGDGRTNLIIRGQSTLFGNAKPLVVIDNFPFEGDIKNINPNDVESITILKDAAAASIWGVRAGNGVIVITTKKGQFDQDLSVNFNSNVTFAGKPDLFYRSSMNPNDIIDLERDLFSKGYYDSSISNTATYPVLSPVIDILLRHRNNEITSDQASNQIDALRNHDLRYELKKYYYRNTANQQYSLNITGGSEKQNFSLSIGYDKNKSSVVGNDFSRYVVSGSQTQRFGKTLELTTSLYYNQNISEIENLLDNVGTSIYPYSRLADDKGNPLAVNRDFRNSFKSAAVSKGLLNWDYVPLEELNLQEIKNKVTGTRLSSGLTYRMVPELSAEVKFQYEYQNTNNRFYRDQNSYFVRNLINRYTSINGTSVNRGIPLGGTLSNTSGDLNSLNGRVQINYNKTWTNHQINAIAGFEAREVRAEATSSLQYGYDPLVGTSGAVNYDNTFVTYPAGSAKIPRGDSNSSTVDRFRSYYINGGYTFLNRYSLTASGRIDQSNLFGVKANQRMVPLWSTGVKWDVDKESFFNSSFFSKLSLRGTFGYNGNLDNTLTAYTTAQLSFSERFVIPAALLQNPPNSDLRWEKTAQMNLGLDFAIKNNLIIGSIEFYRKTGRDLIGQGSIDPTSGFTVYKGNLANMVGKGVDVELTSNNINRTFKWSTNYLFSYTIDEIKDYQIKPTYLQFLSDASLGRNTAMLNPVSGRPLFSVYSYPWAGLDPQTGAPRGYVNGEPSTNYSAITAEIQADPGSNFIYSGPVYAPYFGAIRNTFSYGPLELSFNVTFKFGSYFRRPSINYSSLNQTLSSHADYYLRWQNPGDEQFTNVPALVYPTNAAADSYYANSEVLVEKGDNIRLQDLNVNYVFTRERFKRLPFARIQVYCYGNNLGLLWKANKANIDPDFPTLKPLRSFALGLRLIY